MVFLAPPANSAQRTRGFSCLESPWRILRRSHPIGCRCRVRPCSSPPSLCRCDQLARQVGSREQRSLPVRSAMTHRCLTLRGLQRSARYPSPKSYQQAPADPTVTLGQPAGTGRVTRTGRAGSLLLLTTHLIDRSTNFRVVLSMGRGAMINSCWRERRRETRNRTHTHTVRYTASS